MCPGGGTALQPGVIVLAIKYGDHSALVVVREKTSVIFPPDLKSVRS